MAFESKNPATGEVLQRFEEASDAEVDAALDRARGAFQQWRDCTPEERAEPMHAAARYFRKHKDRFAGLITAEMGKPIAESEAEIEKCAWACDYFADNAARYLRDDRIPTNARESFVAFEPLGAVLAIMPWNFPFWQFIRFGAPAIMAGNAAVQKHAPNVPQCALAIEEVFHESDFPEGLVQNLFISVETTGRLIADDRIAAVTLTGSTRAGSSVATQAGGALKKCVLELGGSDPFIVLEDADMDGAVQFAVKSRYQNTGQSCIAAKRFIVVDAVADEFQKCFVEAVKGLKVGDPSDRDVQIGPLAREDLLENLERQVRESKQAGAKILTGGRRVGGRGYFYEPTVLADIRPEMPAFEEEVFGPVAAVIRVADAVDAVETANNSQYGLGGNLWTRDTERGKALARRIESGNVFINGMTASDPRLPFGGVKRSGFGRELATFGIHEFTNIQTIWVGPAGGQQQPEPSE